MEDTAVIKMNKWIISGVILVVLIGAFLFLSQPQERVDAPQVKEVNSEVYAQLRSNGISDAVVDVTSERALVRYELPDDMEKDQATYLVLGFISSANVSSNEAVVQVYDDYEPVEEWRVSVNSLETYQQGNLTFSEFENSITKEDI